MNHPTLNCPILCQHSSNSEMRRALVQHLKVQLGVTDHDLKDPLPQNLYGGLVLDKNKMPNQPRPGVGPGGPMRAQPMGYPPPAAHGAVGQYGQPAPPPVVQ